MRPAGAGDLKEELGWKAVPVLPPLLGFGLPNYVFPQKTVL